MSRLLEQNNQLVMQLNVQKNRCPNHQERKSLFLAKMASEAGLETTGFSDGKKRSCSNKGPSDEECEIVKEFYLNNEISWQAPGRKDRAILREVVIGKNTKETKQIRFWLMSPGRSV